MQADVDAEQNGRGEDGPSALNAELYVVRPSRRRGMGDVHHGSVAMLWGELACALLQREMVATGKRQRQAGHFAVLSDLCVGDGRGREGQNSAHPAGAKGWGTRMFDSGYPYVATRETMRCEYKSRYSLW